jgi:hypothetical protein
MFWSSSHSFYGRVHITRHFHPPTREVQCDACCVLRVAGTPSSVGGKMSPQPIETDGSPETVTAVATTSSPSAAPSNMLSVVQVRRNSGNHTDVVIDRVAVGPICHTQHSVAPDSHHPTDVPY